jgi:CRISPR-associated protein Csm3
MIRMQLRLLGYYRLSGLIELVTGLHVGAGKDDIEIGGKDNPIILNPGDRVPYIPGSSLKGKLRSLLEWDTGVNPEGKVRGFEGAYDPGDPVLRVFGVPAGDGRDPAKPVLGPTRALFSDCFPANDSEGGTRNGQAYNWRAAFLRGDWQTEEKNENTLNRITAMANPRPMERIPAGVQFAFLIRYRVFDLNGDGGKGDRELFGWVLKGLALLQQDALGGGGSRGNGLVKLEKLKAVDENEKALPADLAAALRDPKLKWVAPEYGR